ncbi:hypothetical protein pipiens_018589 [Culex pipiens pipiens]|uniref:Uncharacterized protein n=1 Tax=Culex pipiens pipiens TaxID=38569 RepID=A0ABD1CB45_CULPP
MYGNIEKQSSIFRCVSQRHQSHYRGQVEVIIISEPEVVVFLELVFGRVHHRMFEDVHARLTISTSTDFRDELIHNRIAVYHHFSFRSVAGAP